MKKITTKELNAKIFPYILNAISADGYGKKVNSDKEKLNFLAATFKSEYGYPENLKRYGSHQEVMRQWIMGLPSCFNIDFENYRIIEIAKEWGSLTPGADDRQEDKILNNWFNLVASKTFQLFRKHGITI